MFDNIFDDFSGNNLCILTEKEIKHDWCNLVEFKGTAGPWWSYAVYSVAL